MRRWRGPGGGPTALYRYITEIPLEGITYLLHHPAHSPPLSLPRDSACAWQTNLPAHSLPPSFTWYTGYEGQRLRDEDLFICWKILGEDPSPMTTAVCDQIDVKYLRTVNIKLNMQMFYKTFYKYSYFEQGAACLWQLWVGTSINSLNWLTVAAKSPVPDEKPTKRSQRYGTGSEGFCVFSLSGKLFLVCAGKELSFLRDCTYGNKKKVFFGL